MGKVGFWEIMAQSYLIGIKDWRGITGSSEFIINFIYCIVEILKEIR